MRNGTNRRDGYGRRRESLQLDAAFTAEFIGGDQVFRVASGDSATLNNCKGDSQQLCDSYCARVVDGVFPI